MAKYSYVKAGVDGSLLSAQIAGSSIAKTPCGISCTGDALDISFMVNLSQGEQDALAAIVTAHDACQGAQYYAMHKKETYTGNKLTKEEWFETCDAQGNMSGLSKANEYTWQGNKLMRRLEKQYFKCGVVIEQHEYTYITVSGNLIERKVS